MSYKCSDCDFSLWDYVGRVWNFPNYCYVGLYDDNRYPGRCLVVFDKHKEILEELNSYELEYFTNCMVRVGSIIKELTGAKRINYAILGNTESHVHAHVIPRFDNDPNPKKSPWDRPDKACPMDKDKLNSIKIKLSEQLRRI